MNSRMVAVVMVTASSLGAQGQVSERRASMRGGGNPYNGKCTIEVVVDGSAEVEIRGDRALLRNLDGRPPEWRRFECTGVMSPNPGDFRFQGIDGRGRQKLVRDPRGNRGVAVVLLEDPDNGAEGYTFDLIWSANGSSTPYGGYGDRGNSRDYDPRDYDPRNDPRNGPGNDRGRDDGGRFANLFERTRADLDQARNSFGGRGDEYRLQQVFEELDELQRDYSRGRVNNRHLDDVIKALRRVLRDNRLGRRDRDNLSDDVDGLRQLREQR